MLLLLRESHLQHPTPFPPHISTPIPYPPSPHPFPSLTTVHLLAARQRHRQNRLCTTIKNNSNKIDFIMFYIGNILHQIVLVAYPLGKWILMLGQAIKRWVKIIKVIDSHYVLKWNITVNLITVIICLPMFMFQSFIFLNHVHVFLTSVGLIEANKFTFIIYLQIAFTFTIVAISYT